MKKIICFLLTVLFCGQADAQILSGEQDSGVKRIRPIKAEQPVSLNMDKANVFSVTTDENQPTDIDEDDEETALTLMEKAFESDADVVIVPLQDAMLLGSDARMNVPGQLGKNWCWQAKQEDMGEAADLLRKLIKASGR